MSITLAYSFDYIILKLMLQNAKTINLKAFVAHQVGEIALGHKPTDIGFKDL